MNGRLQPLLLQHTAFAPSVGGTVGEPAMMRADRLRVGPAGWPIGVAVAFFVVIPTVLGSLLGASRSGLAMYLPWQFGVLFWVLASTGVWLAMFTGSWLAGVLLRPWRPPLWLILSVGAMIGSLPGRYIIYRTARLFAGVVLEGRQPQPAPPLVLSLEFVVGYLQLWFGVFVAWVVIGLLFDRWQGLPRYGRRRTLRAAGVERAGSSLQESQAATDAPPAEAGATPRGGVFDRLPEKLGQTILALKAEDHYTRVYTDRGSALVLYRFSDAVNEMGEQDGLQVHRSWWVRKDSVCTAVAHGRGYLLTLSTGLTVPVSQTYKALVREAGVTERLPTS